MANQDQLSNVKLSTTKIHLDGKAGTFGHQKIRTKKSKIFYGYLSNKLSQKMEKYYLRSIHLFSRVTFLFYLFVCAIFDTKFLEMYL